MMPFDIKGLLSGIGLTGTATGLEGDLATLLASTSPEGLLARGAIIASGAAAAQPLIHSVQNLLGGRKSRKTSRKSHKRRISMRRSRKTRKSGRSSKYRSKAWMKHIRKMRKH